MTDFVPNNQRFPLVAININNQFAVQGATNQPYNALFIGSKVAAGRIDHNVVTKVLSIGDAVQKFGRGSSCYEFARGYFAAESNNPLYMMALDDSASAFKARVATITLTAASAVRSGTLNVYIAGRKYILGVSSGETVTEIATNLANLITADTEALFSASNAAGVITLTSKSKGAFTNEFQVEHSIGTDESLPGSLVWNLADTTPGEGTPTTISADSLEDEFQYILWSTAFTENAFLTLIDTELKARNSAVRKVDGFNIVAVRNGLAALTAKGNNFNTQFLSMFPLIGNTNALYVSGALVGLVSRVKSQDAAASLQNLELPGVMAPNPKDVLSNSELNTLLMNGISAYKILNGRYQIASLITTYKTDAFGVADISYLDLSVLLILSYLRYDLNVLAVRRFMGAKIGRDGVRYNSNQKIVTPRGIKGEIVNRFTDWELAGLVENKGAFAQSLVVERDSGDVNQINIFLYPDTVNELKVLGIDIRFLL